MTTRKPPQEQLSDMLKTPTSGSPYTRAQEAVDQVRQRAEDAGHEVADRADHALDTAGDHMHDAARTIRKRAPSGQIGDVAGKAAEALDRSGDYLRDKDVNSMRGDLMKMVRKHPLQSLVIGLGVVFLIIRSMRSRRD